MDSNRITKSAGKTLCPKAAKIIHGIIIGGDTSMKKLFLTKVKTELEAWSPVDLLLMEQFSMQQRLKA